MCLDKLFVMIHQPDTCRHTAVTDTRHIVVIVFTDTRHRVVDVVTDTRHIVFIVVTGIRHLVVVVVRVTRHIVVIVVIIIIIINPLTARVVGAPRMILQPVFSIFPCSPLPSGTCRTPGLSIP